MFLTIVEIILKFSTELKMTNTGESKQEIKMDQLLAPQKIEKKYNHIDKTVYI